MENNSNIEYKEISIKDLEKREYPDFDLKICDKEHIVIRDRKGKKLDFKNNRNIQLKD